MNLVLQTGPLGLLALLMTALIALYGLFALAGSQRRTAAARVFALATAPLLIGLAGTGLGWLRIRRMERASAGNVSPADWEHGMAQAWTATYLGVACALVLIVIAAVGFLLGSSSEDEVHA